MTAHETKILFLVTPGKQDSSGQAALRNLSKLEEPPEGPDNQGVLTCIKKLATYMSDLAATFLGFTRDAEASALGLSKDLERISILTEAAHVRLVQDEDIEQEQGTVWGAIRNEV